MVAQARFWIHVDYSEPYLIMILDKTQCQRKRKKDHLRLEWFLLLPATNFVPTGSESAQYSSRTYCTWAGLTLRVIRYQIVRETAETRTIPTTAQRTPIRRETSPEGVGDPPGGVLRTGDPLEGYFGLGTPLEGYRYYQ
ncbi:hypothetical protein Bbelb_167320 [Branchiostoma belcheri]|nr:hypothetical protein Bbelb_167320 [Branchiostoma belcheri]